MAKVKDRPKQDDACPNCGGAFKPRRALTAEEYAAVTDKSDPRAFPHGADTASPAVVAELGPLVECDDCGYRTRLTPVDAK